MSVEQVDRFRLHDDSEEDLVGTDWQQRAIVQIYDALLDVATIHDLPWHVGNQLPLAAWTPERTSWRPSPDIMVHPAACAAREEMSAREDGPPALVIEVLSKTTWRYDVDDVGGKAAGYMALGVPEYLTFDPTGGFLAVPCRGWRLENGVTQAWEPEAGGNYWSRTLGIGVRPEGTFLRVLDSEGRPIPTRQERLEENGALAQNNDTLARNNDSLKREVEVRDAEIVALRAALAEARDRNSPSDAEQDAGEP